MGCMRHVFDFGIVESVCVASHENARVIVLLRCECVCTLLRDLVLWSVFVSEEGCFLIPVISRNNGCWLKTATFPCPWITLRLEYISIFWSQIDA